MAAGKRAFQRKSVVQTLAAIIQEEPEPVGANNPQVPVPLRWIIERCLAKEPEDRYVSTRDLARELATVRDRLAEASLSGAVLAAEPPSPGLRVRGVVLALGVLAAIAAGVFAGKPFWRARFSSHPTLRQVTFRRVGLNWARFAPDGRTIVYGAAVGGPGELFSATPGTPEPRSLGLPPASLLSISTSGELAILVGGSPNRGTLATVSLAGGAPRELLENVWRADWTPDGKSLAVAHQVKDRIRLEFPIGRVLYEAPGLMSGIHFSPKGDRIAFGHRESWVPGAANGADIIVIDLAGRRSTLTRIPYEFNWSPRGDEIWFNEIEGGMTTIQGMALSGKKRFIASFPGDLALHDVSRDGRALLERVSEQSEIVGRYSGEPAERNLSWLDGSVPADLSADGTLLLFTEVRHGGGPKKAVYKRKTDGSPAIRLGDGRALALSPDGLWALAVAAADGSQLVLLPIGPGQPRTLTLPGIRLVGAGARFFPDGKRILLRASDPGGQMRLYALDIDSGKARAITPEGIGPQSVILVSPDGRAVLNSGGKGSFLYDVEGGPPRPVPALSPGVFPIKWCADGRALFVTKGDINPLKVYRLDLSSGRMELWREFSFSDVGENGAADVIPTPDGKSYVYGYTRSFADLFIAEGLK
jgi:Tol biopolymer transport system component